MDNSDLLDRLRTARISHEEIAEALGRSRTAATNLLNGKRSLKANEVEPLMALLGKHDALIAPRGFLPGATLAYDRVPILPVFADVESSEASDFALIPTRLIRDQLRGTPEDFFFIEVLGDSMAPDFMRGDHVMIDRRDTNPSRPGAFAVFEEDTYVLKNIERLNGALRVFSSNPKYRETIATADAVTILGRPVWFGRQL